MQVSLAHWNQDEAWGGFGGPHCMVKGGYSSLMEPLAATGNIQLGIAVRQISYNNQGVKVTSASGEPACVITPVLKPHALLGVVWMETAGAQGRTGYRPCLG